MTMTKKTVIYWTKDAMDLERDAWLAQATADGKTDGVALRGRDQYATRLWRDQAAADEWEAFITDLARRYGRSCTVVTTDLELARIKPID